MKSGSDQLHYTYNRPSATGSQTDALNYQIDMYLPNGYLFIFFWLRGFWSEVLANQ